MSELDVLNRFRSDIPEPSSDAWQRARAAIAAARLQGADAGPPKRGHIHVSRPRGRTLLALLGSAGGAVAASVAALLLTAGSAPSTAFAGWTPTPTAPTSAGQVATAEAACRQQRAYPGEPGYAGLTPTVVDTRGPWTLLVYIDGTSHEACTVAPSGAASQTTMTGPEVPVARGTIRWRSADRGAGFDRTQGDPYSYLAGDPHSDMYGEVGAGVTAATLVLEDGTKVTTTITNGWFAAWWPGESAVTSAEVTTAHATTTESFPELQRDHQLQREEQRARESGNAK